MHIKLHPFARFQILAAVILKNRVLLECWGEAEGRGKRVLRAPPGSKLDGKVIILNEQKNTIFRAQQIFNYGMEYTEIQHTSLF